MAQSKGHLGMAILCAFVWGLAVSKPAWGVEFAGGTGEPNAPYQVATAQQLISIGSDWTLARKHYVLAASIDLSGVNLSEPVIGSFSGTFDGKGHTIRNLRVEGGIRSGLFGFILSGAEVRNLGVIDARVVGIGYPGGLASHNFGSVLNCYSTGVVIGTVHSGGGLIGYNNGTVANSHSAAQVSGSSYLGGLVGENIGTVSSCYFTGEVTGYGTVGGLVGFNYREITWSYCVATVTGLAWQVGGLVGHNGGTITSCYCDVTVAGQDDFVGGLVGCNRNTISSCYSTGNVTGQDIVGGLVGDNTGKIAMSYSAAAVEGYGRNVGGLVGLLSIATATTGKNCYFLDPLDGGGPDNKIGTPLTSGQMKRQASFAGWDFWGTAADGVSAPWFMPANAYPVLAWQTDITGLRVIPNVVGLPLDEARAALTAAGFAVGNVSYDFDRAMPSGCVIRTDPHPLASAGASIALVVSSDGTYNWAGNPGDGTQANPYQIQTAGQLESLTDHPELWNKHFVLSADVDMLSRTYSAALIAPDVDNSNSGFQGTPFSGTFNGQGHAIRNLTIHSDTKHNYLGLFGMIAQGGKINDLHLLDVDIAGGTGSSTYLGALAGYNAGTVTNCSATGILHGGKGDGMVGFNAGSLIDCQADTTRR